MLHNIEYAGLGKYVFVYILKTRVPDSDLTEIRLGDGLFLFGRQHEVIHVLIILNIG